MIKHSIKEFKRKNDYKKKKRRPHLGNVPTLFREAFPRRGLFPEHSGKASPIGEYFAGKLAEFPR